MGGVLARQRTALREAGRGGNTNIAASLGRSANTLGLAGGGGGGLGQSTATVFGLQQSNGLAGGGIGNSAATIMGLHNSSNSLAPPELSSDGGGGHTSAATILSLHDTRSSSSSGESSGGSQNTILGRHIQQARSNNSGRRYSVEETVRARVSQEVNAMLMREIESAGAAKGAGKGAIAAAKGAAAGQAFGGGAKGGGKGSSKGAFGFLRDGSHMAAVPEEDENSVARDDGMNLSEFFASAGVSQPGSPAKGAWR